MSDRPAGPKISDSVLSPGPPSARRRAIESDPMAAQHLEPRVLVHTRTTDYRHESIPDGIAAVRSLGAAHGFTVHATEAPDFFDAPVGPYAAVVFLSTSGDILTPAGRSTSPRTSRRAAASSGCTRRPVRSTTGPTTASCSGQVARHPEHQPGKAVVEDRDHPATRHLPAVWEFTDEWYDSARTRATRCACSSPPTNPRTREAAGDDHPLVWCREQGAGRVFYTALGHARRPTRTGLPAAPARRNRLGGANRRQMKADGTHL